MRNRIKNTPFPVRHNRNIAVSNHDIERVAMPPVLSTRRFPASGPPTGFRRQFVRLLRGLRSQVVVDGLPGVIRQLEFDRTPRLLLAYCRAVDGVPVGAMSSTLSATTSQPLSLLSIAKLNMARSRCGPDLSRVLIAQTCFGRKGGLAPTSLPLFQGVRAGTVIRQAPLSGMALLLGLLRPRSLRLRGTGRGCEKRSPAWRRGARGDRAQGLLTSAYYQ
jgi:hypothetical protein